MNYLAWIRSGWNACSVNGIERAIIHAVSMEEAHSMRMRIREIRQRRQRRAKRAKALRRERIKAAHAAKK